MLKVAEFFARKHWGDEFHKVRYIRVGNRQVKSVHSGRDINGWKAHVEVPFLAGGEVVNVGTAADIGHFIEVKVSPTRFDTYCHILPDVIEGHTYRAGQRAAFLAGPDDVHGSMWSGTHLHFMVARTSGAWANRGKCIDPDPFIVAALTAAAGGDATPFPIPEKPIVKDMDMRILYNQDAPDSADATRRAIVGELSFQVITGPQSTRERKFWGDPVNVTVGEWNAARDLVILRRTELGLPVVVSPDGGVGGGLTDTQAQTLAAVAETLATLRVPTAAENATATVTEQAKRLGNG